MRTFMLDAFALLGVCGVVISVGLYAPLLVPGALGVIFLGAAFVAHLYGDKS